LPVRNDDTPRQADEEDRHMSELQEPVVLLSRPVDGVAVVTLNRPSRRNALTRHMLASLIEVFSQLAQESAAGDLRAVVLTGADPAFCAGLDLNEIAELGPPDLGEFDVVNALVGVGVPVIGAINGAAATGGLELALACDFRIAGESASFADTHARVGVVPGWGLTARLPLAVGQAWARQMSATGNYVNAPAALRIGLVNEVVPHESLLQRAVELAGEVASVDAGVLTTIRSLYDATAADGAGAAMRSEVALWNAGSSLPDPSALALRHKQVLDRGRAQRSE
jgi:enoyl-CoA hydratase